MFPGFQIFFVFFKKAFLYFLYLRIILGICDRYKFVSFLAQPLDTYLKVLLCIRATIHVTTYVTIFLWELCTIF